MASLGLYLVYYNKKPQINTTRFNIFSLAIFIYFLLAQQRNPVHDRKAFGLPALVALY